MFDGIDITSVQHCELRCLRQSIQLVSHNPYYSTMDQHYSVIGVLLELFRVQGLKPE